MLFEYAVEPSALDNWATIRYFMDRLGIGEGRLVAKYPADWAKRVNEACADAKPAEKLRIVEGLNALQKRLIKTNRAYRPEATWLDNALQIHDTFPFQAVIGRTTCEHPRFLQIDDIDDETPFWKVPRDGNIDRTAQEIAKIAGPLLYLSGEVCLVDQHYSNTAKYGRPLAALLHAARCGKQLIRIEYHLNSDDTSSEFESALKRQIPHLGLRDKESIVFVRWGRIDGGENQHPRYILTNRGGLRFDYGLDEGEGTTDWARLSEELWRQRWEQFKPDSKVFAFVEAYEGIMAPAIPSRTNNYASATPLVTRVYWTGTKWDSRRPTV